MIMAAGVGSRLMPLTMDTPKPMIPVANLPLMENTINLLKIHEYSQLICNVHHHADIISQYFGDGGAFGVEMQYSQEEKLLGTAGGVKNCQYFLDETFVVISGDALTDIDLGFLLQEHKARGALATIALKDVEEVESFGVVVTDENGRILRFQEKPRRTEALSHQANTGIYLFEPEIFQYIPARKFYDFGQQVFPQLVQMGAPFYGIGIRDYWCDVGNLNTYRQANADILTGQVRAATRGRLEATQDGGRVLIGDGVEIGSHVRLSGCVVLGDRCRIEGNSIISNSVIWEDCTVGQGSVINGAVIGAACQVGTDSLIRTGATLASGCRLEPGSDISPGAKIHPLPGGGVETEQA
ncbi:MAG TPA: NDP-sugar synthase [Syntrophomonadaceae bacterium]|nr:NDP-sugar synthase [Syntrophomonadaceae bacterium]